MSHTMTVFVITHSQRGEEEANILSVHTSLEGAKAALIKWGQDRWEDHADERFAKYLSDSGKSLLTEEDTLFILECPVLP